MVSWLTASSLNLRILLLVLIHSNVSIGRPPLNKVFAKVKLLNTIRIPQKSIYLVKYFPLHLYETYYILIILSEGEEKRGYFYGETKKY